MANLKFDTGMRVKTENGSYGKIAQVLQSVYKSLENSYLVWLDGAIAPQWFDESKLTLENTITSADALGQMHPEDDKEKFIALMVEAIRKTEFKEGTIFTGIRVSTQYQ